MASARDFRASFGHSRASSLGGTSSARGSRSSGAGQGGPGTRDVEFDFFIHRNEQEYPPWWTRKRLQQEFYTLSEDSYWNSFICLMVLLGVMWVALGLQQFVFIVLDVVFNASYAVHIFSITYNIITHLDTNALTFCTALAFLVDMATFSHYASNNDEFKFCCYYLRLHRPISYLWAMNDKNLRGSVLGTTLKFCYVFLVMRVSWALIWLNIDVIERTLQNTTITHRALETLTHHAQQLNVDQALDDNTAVQFLNAFYLVNKMFIPIGPSVPPANDVERITCMCIMLSGCLIVTAFAVASLSLVISLYMRPEETFRARYRLIIKEMKDSHIPPSQCDKVETFYKMYWHKQRAVSATQLMPTFPPTLPATIYTEIYFEATQKSRVLCDLSYQFLSELSKKMETIHYIPGDAIMRRLSTKSSYIYITYGDIEMVTAEDDCTAILRMTRGTALSSCAVCAPAGFGRAHLEVRAASFCTAHVLSAKELWKVVIRHGATEEESELMLGAYNDHLERVKAHFKAKGVEEVKHKSSILHFKRCLMALKEAKDAQGTYLLAHTDIFLEIAGNYVMRNIHPYYLVFKKVVPLEFRFFDHFVSGIYILDLIVHLSTGANVEEGVPITFTQTSSQQMRSYWFVLDVLGTLPIFEFISEGHFAGINKILRMPKVFRVLKQLEDKCVYQGHILRFFSYTLLLFMASYLVAAVQQGFMCFQFDHCLVTNLTHSPYWEKKPLDEETIENRLTFALYWAMSMIIFAAHMETWGTEYWRDVIYTLALLEVCIVLRIFIDSVYSATILVTTALREDYDASILVVKNFMIRNQVDPVLRHRFISYLQLCWYTDKAYSMTNKRSIFYDLPPHVYQDIVATQRNKYILCIPFMKYVKKEVLKNISSRARLFYASANEVLLSTGDISNEMYVIKRGICEILSPETQGVIGLLSVKSHFGVLVCLMRLPSFYTIRAVTNVQLFSISRKILMQAINDPHIQDALEFCRESAEYKRLLVRRASFISYKPPDPIPNMQRFPLPRKHEADSEFLNPFYNLGFFSILRYIFPRYTIRPDGQYLVRYEWFRAVCAFSAAMVFPSYAYMVVQWPWLYYIAMLLDFSAYFDMLQRMLVGYYNESGILVYHPASTAAYYLKGAFFTDLLGCIPLENLESAQVEIGELNRYCVTEMQQFLMLNRLLQLYRVPGAMTILGNFIERRDILLVLRAIPLFMVLMNVLTCFMMLFSVTICTDPKSNLWHVAPIQDQGGSWVELFRHQFRFNLTESPLNLHLVTYFWMVYETSTTGYNTLKPSNVIQIRVLFIGMLIGAMMLTYFSVRIISIRANVNKDLAEFQEHMKDMVLFMKREHLKEDLQKVVLDYYEYTWDKMGGVDYRNMFKLCDQINLRTDAILQIYGPTFGKCPIITYKDISLLRIIGRAVHSAYFLRGMNIIESNDVVSDMYFVDYGGVDAKEVLADIVTLVKLPRGSVFGNLDGTATARCPVTFTATSKAHLLRINSLVFHNIIKDFPAVQELLEKFRPENDKKSYIMGNVADNYQTAHQRAISSGPVVVTSRKGLIKYLYFKDKYIQLYLIVISLVCVFADTYNAGYQDNSNKMIIVLYTLDICFYLKILHQYTLPMIVDVANIRKILLPIRKAYFRGEFRYDLMSCIPFEVFCLLDDDDKWRVFSCLRLNRVFRLVTVSKCLKRHQERITINLTLTTIVSAVIWFALFVHVTSCLWFFIGSLEDQKTPKSSWIYKDDGTSWCHNMYICSLYFVLTTFTQNGVGDIMPKKQSEVIFVCILQILSTMIFLIYIGEFSNLIQYRSFRCFSFYSQYLELQDFLKNNRVSKNLMHIVNQYSLHLWRETRGMQAPHFLHTAPQAMKLQVMSAAYLHHLTRHHVFENCESAFLRQLVGCLQLMTYNEDMYVVKSSEITDAMYLIHTGKIQEIADVSNKVPRIYPAGSYFGVAQGLIHDLPYTHSYRTLSKAQVLTLRLDDWFNLLKHYPQSKEAISRHIQYDDDDDYKDGGHQDRWSMPRPPKPSRQMKATKPPLVSEVLDKDSPPTPPPDNSGGVPAHLPTKFTIPEGPQQLNDDDAPVSLQPGLYPTTNRRVLSRSSADKLNDEVKQVPSKVTERSSFSQLSATMGVTANNENENDEEASSKDDLLLQEVKAAASALMKDLDRTHGAEKDQNQSGQTEQGMLNELLSNVNDSYSVGSAEGKKEEETEEHMVTVDITGSQTNMKQEDTIATVDYEDTVLLPFSTSNQEIPGAKKPKKLGKVEKVARFGDESNKDGDNVASTTSVRNDDDEASSSQRKRIRVQYEEEEEKKDGASDFQ